MKEVFEFENEAGTPASVLPDGKAVNRKTGQSKPPFPPISKLLVDGFQIAK
ncbi:MAG: hypothetical protein ABI600_07115 [Luteolibacter sp.]